MAAAAVAAAAMTLLSGNVFATAATAAFAAVIKLHIALDPTA
jgi:hypothetical protein